VLDTLSAPAIEIQRAVLIGYMQKNKTQRQHCVFGLLFLHK